MKLSWGYKIAGAYIIFVAGMVFLVIKANSKKFDLVTKDYYGEELKYQQVIDQAANVTALSSSIEVEKKGNELVIRFPAEMRNVKKEIEFYLYCPADAKKDFKKYLVVNEMGFKQEVPGGSYGLYELRLTWMADSKKYYYEKKIIL
jgi:hypothetical protein